MTPPLALVVDDEEQMLAIVTFALSTQGFATRTASDVASAWQLLTTTQFDLVVLDIMLPHGSGLDLTRRIRARSLQPPIILLTALGEEHNRIAGLEAGADDYVTKPFSPRELALRAEAICRRTGNTEIREDRFGELTVTNSRIAFRRRLLQLSATETRLLECLISAGGQPVPRIRLLNEVWDTTSQTGGTDMIKTSIYRLRRKLKDQGVSGMSIATVPGGYQLISETDR